MVAGPCSAESEEQILGTAQELSQCGATLLRGGIWKPRTSPGSFDDVGEKGLSWLKAAGDAAGLRVATEVATPSHVDHCLAAGIDVVWIGARTATSPITVQKIANALAGVDIPVMIKNPMNPELKLWAGAIDRIRRAGVTRTVAVHRGFSTHIRHQYRYRPLWEIPLGLRREVPEIPIFYDPSHISGNRRFVSEVSEKAIGLGFDGLMVECHWCPGSAMSDRDQQLSPAQFSVLAEAVNQILREKASVHNRLFLPEDVNEIDQDLRTLLSRRMLLLRSERKEQHRISIKNQIAIQATRLLAILLALLARGAPLETGANSSDSRRVQSGSEALSSLATSS